MTVWNITKDNSELTFPGGRGDDCRYTIDWGDGNRNTYSSCGNRKHTYDKSGEYTIRVEGKLSNWQCYNGYYSEKLCSSTNYLTEVKSFGPVILGKFAFGYAKQLEKVSQVDIPNAVITDMIYMFEDATSFNHSINNWDTSNVTGMSGMFCGASSFDQPLNKWDTGNVKNMSEMFWLASSFNQSINNWNTSNVTNMERMFSYATSFNQPLNDWDTCNVGNMRYMFQHAESFDQPLEQWCLNSVSDQWSVDSVSDVALMFSGSGLSKENWLIMQAKEAWAKVKHSLGLPSDY